MNGIALPGDRRAPGPFLDSCWLGPRQLNVGVYGFIVFHVYEACCGLGLGIVLLYYSANLIQRTDDSSTSLLLGRFDQS